MPPEGLEGGRRVFRNAVAKNGLDNEVALAGSFCSGRCNRIGVTVTIDDTVHTGVTPENFNDFFEDNVLAALSAERK